MSIDSTRKPFHGPWEGDTKIVVGIDIGTTQSGVAFAFLQNGASQVIHRVTRWPGQEAHNQQGKIPTLVWYDTNRRAVSFGAEAQLHTTEEQAEDNDWMLARYFKLHLHPSDMQARHELKLDPLPQGVSLRQIYSDFLGYLLKHTKSYFEDRILDGKNIWERYSPEVVIAHPNGWGIREQAFLRSAAVAAGFATAEEALSKIRVLRPGMNFAVCDAGGSTVDTTIYGITSCRPVLKLEEKRASACVQAGAIFVDFEAEKYLRRTLSGAGLSSEDVVEYSKAGVKDFENFAKRAFRDETTEQSVGVAHTRFNNSAIRARRGRMTISGSTIKGFFDVCVNEIIESVDQQLAGLSVPYILLVGGFGDSGYVRNEFKKRYEPRGSKVTLTNDSTESYRHLYATAHPDLELYTFDLLAYSGDDKPEWALSPSGAMLPKFQNACTVRANLRNLQGALKSDIGSHGSRYWTLNYDVCIRFGGTELEGYMEWEEAVSVSGWQEAHNQQGKIPTLVWYDTSKKAVSFGAEAQLYTTEEQAEDNGWILAKYFKLHLHPSDMQTKHELKLDPLPPGVSLRQIYSDFLGYLLEHTRSYFEDRILDGKAIWERHSPTMEVVIAHPNGWGIREQAFLRSAAVAAGFSTSEEARSKVRFVTEAEASVHFCIHHTNLGNALHPGMNFAVCDAGGSTVDTTIYGITSARPILKLKEERASACVQAGAIFVDFEIEKFLHKTLASVGLSSDDIKDYTKAGVKDFESFAKRAFKDEATEQSVAVAHTRFNNASIRARRGRMTLSGSTIKDFFDVCVNEITASVDQQIDELHVPYILLVGGFGDSLYIKEQFKKRYEARGSQITLTNDSTSKAVADGAVIWNILSSVHSRAPRYSFGAAIAVPFLPGIHQMRIPYTSARGQQMVFGAWSQIVQKGIALDSEVVCRRPYAQLYTSATPDLELYTVDLLAYSGEDVPGWAYDPNRNFHSGFQDACTIRANLKGLEGALVSDVGRNGTRYWTLRFNVCIRFGGTELESYLEWEENGVKHTGPVSLVPQDVDL
ncbi:unnamed protein product [Rhizoctonia solani]|uniref:Heat shock 70 kDa protein 12A n=1 Tax=Rhizoctonia solani TaxID=456999 RepID=A0A8H3A1H5_9AGAM|nr:unnamed protein product [Rhizoctonia solani]